MKINVTKLAATITTLGGAVAVLVAFLTWGLSVHNSFLMEMISPLLRTAYVTRINNYRRIECMGPLTVSQQVAYDEVLADYAELVGRPIGSSRDCDSL